MKRTLLSIRDRIRGLELFSEGGTNKFICKNLRIAEAELVCVRKEVDRLEIQWDDSNVIKKPITVILKEL